MSGGGHASVTTIASLDDRVRSIYLPVCLFTLRFRLSCSSRAKPLGGALPPGRSSFETQGCIRQSSTISEDEYEMNGKALWAVVFFFPLLKRFYIVVVSSLCLPPSLSIFSYCSYYASAGIDITMSYVLYET